MALGVRDLDRQSDFYVHGCGLQIVDRTTRHHFEDPEKNLLEWVTEITTDRPLCAAVLVRPPLAARRQVSDRSTELRCGKSEIDPHPVDKS
jgi:hypothetical protein